MSHATNNAITQITEVVSRVTRMLSNRSITVIQEGMKLGVEYDAKGAPNKVYLPSLSDNPSPELLVAVQGFLDKEVSTLLYTDHDYRHKMRATPDFKKGMAKSLQDIIEDSRTEREMRREFRGSAANFNKNHDFAVKEIIAPKHATEIDPKKRIANLAMPAIRAAAGDLAYEEFMADKWTEIGPLGGAILHYADEIQSAESTKDTYELTRKIMRKMEQLESGEGGDDDDEDEDGEEGEGTAPGLVAGEGDEEGEGASEGEGEGEGESSGATGQVKNEDLSKNNENADKRNKDRPKPSGNSGTQQGISEFSDYDDAFEAADWNAAAAEKIKKFAKDDQVNASYIPYSRQYDYVGPFINSEAVIAKFNGDQTAVKIYEQAHSKSHVIQQQVQKLFMAKSLTRWEPGLRRGRINPASLHRLPHGDERVFRRKIESNSRDVAVSLLIDMSGSMANRKVQYACIAAMMFSNVLTKLNIAHEISAFTTYHGGYYSSAGSFPHAKEVNTMLSGAGRHSDPHGITYARYAPIVNYIAKGYDDRLTEETKRLVAMIPSGYRNSMANNVDGESVEIAGRRLLQRKEKKKVMIVMSDGSPAADGSGYVLSDHLKTVVKSLTGAGVEMLGLGLQDESVKRFYPKSEVVTQVEQIPDKILELTRQMVVGV